jgi:hypothetical protein
MCYKAEEHITHVGRCTTLVPSEYTSRHKKVADYIYSKLTGLQGTEKYYGYIPERVISVNHTTTVWDVPGYQRLKNISRWN